MVTLVGAAVRRHDSGRLSLPSGVPWPDGLGVAAVGYAWAELTTDPGSHLPVGRLRAEKDGRFVLAGPALRVRFLPDPAVCLLVLVFGDGSGTHVVVADTRYWPHLIEPSFEPPSFFSHPAWTSPWRAP